ncbi:MAG: lipocalin family protein [Candidatus Moduliflexus flocculans]|nr:lipocalin family protein [Candidatus Moduliflexus flocculans]
MKPWMIILIFVFVAGAAARAAAQAKPLKVVPRVDIERYLGTWYEIATIPQRFQKGCVEGYQAVVGHPDRTYYWILSRTLRWTPPSTTAPPPGRRQGLRHVKDRKRPFNPAVDLAHVLDDPLERVVDHLLMFDISRRIAPAFPSYPEGSAGLLDPRP